MKIVDCKKILEKIFYHDEITSVVIIIIEYHYTIVISY